MTSNRPYLLRALHEWILDNGLTPYILVDASVSGVQVPTEYVREDSIVLNISPDAIRELVISNEWVQFNARFNGQAMNVAVPMPAVQAIYARENGQNMVFTTEDAAVEHEPAATVQETTRPHLKVVK